jgi:hypothetical protein
MHPQHKNAYHPHVHSVGEKYQESGDSMVQQVLIIVSVLPNKHVNDKPG